MNFPLTGDAGRIEARLDAPDGAVRAAVVLAPPHPEHGGTLHSRVLHEASVGLRRAGCAVLRFNYRGVGRSAGTFGGGEAERRDVGAALEALASTCAGAPLWAAGYSFGAWAAMVAGAADRRVRALIGIGAPLDTYDFSPAAASEKAKFLVHGELDELCPLKVAQRHYGGLAEPRELIVIEGADHAFDGKASEVGDALFELLEDFTA